MNCYWRIIIINNIIKFSKSTATQPKFLNPPFRLTPPSVFFSFCENFFMLKTIILAKITPISRRKYRNSKFQTIFARILIPQNNFFLRNSGSNLVPVMAPRNIDVHITLTFSRWLEISAMLGMLAKTSVLSFDYLNPEHRIYQNISRNLRLYKYMSNNFQG